MNYSYISWRANDDASILCDSEFRAKALVRLGAKIRVTENRCVIFDFATYVCLALLEQH